MNLKEINGFFEKLDRKLDRPAEVILTGAAAGAVMGNVRPSVDIDFEIRFTGKKALYRDAALLEQTVKEAASEDSIAVNFGEDISRWSMIDYLDYRRTAQDYRTIGKIRVKIMAPGHWTIGKLSRFLELDILDVVKIIKKKKLNANKLIPLWAKAFSSSPLSLAKGRFRDNVIYFLKKYGVKVWGQGFDPDRAVSHFKKLAGIKRSHGFAGVR